MKTNVSEESIPLSKVINKVVKPTKKVPTRKVVKKMDTENSSKPPKISRADKRSVSDMEPLAQSKNKRTAFGDITNALQPGLRIAAAKRKPVGQTGGSRKFTGIVRKTSNVTAKNNSKVTIKENTKKVAEEKPMEEDDHTELPRHVVESESLSSSNEVTTTNENSPVPENLDWIFTESSKEESQVDEEPDMIVENENLDATADTDQEMSEIRVVDKDPDPNVVSEYAKSIFDNMREREVSCVGNENTYM